MDQAAFLAALAQDGYSEISTRIQAPLHANSVHSHPFSARGLIVSGEMTLRFDGKTQVCKAGDTFAMHAGCEHEEIFGPEGATYVVGRRQ